MTSQNVETLLYFQHGLLSSISVALTGATRDLEQAWDSFVPPLEAWSQEVEEDKATSPKDFDEMQGLADAVITEESNLTSVGMTLKKHVQQQENATLDVIDALFEGKEVDISTCIFTADELNEIRDTSNEYLATVWRINQDCKELETHITAIGNPSSNVTNAHDALMAAIEHLIGGCQMIERNIVTLTHVNEKISKFTAD